MRDEDNWDREERDQWLTQRITNTLAQFGVTDPEIAWMIRSDMIDLLHDTEHGGPAYRAGHRSGRREIAADLVRTLTKDRRKVGKFFVGAPARVEAEHVLDFLKPYVVIRKRRWFGW